MKVINREERAKTFSGFLTGLCAVLGGTLTVAAAVDRGVYEGATRLRKPSVILPIPAPQSTALGSLSFAAKCFDCRRSFARKLLEPCRSIRETCGKPPKTPLTVGSVEDQYSIAAAWLIRESGAGSAPFSSGSEMSMSSAAERCFLLKPPSISLPLFYPLSQPDHMISQLMQ